MSEISTNRSIIVVEPTSTNNILFNDISEIGYQPISLELLPNPENVAYMRQMHDFYYYEEYHTKNLKILMCKPTYEETLKIVKDFNPVLILPGSDDGLYLAMRLSEDLGLKSNLLVSFPTFRNKSLQQKCLAKSNLNHINTMTIKTSKEACDLLRKSENHKIIIKPGAGRASVGVSVCENNEQVIAAIANIDNIKETELDPTESSSQILCQEYIDGTEYVVNTMTSNNRTVVTGLSYYQRIELADPLSVPVANTYDNGIDPKSELGKLLISYALNVPKALGLKYGPIHGEYKLTDNGPVLIEANFRLMGASKKRDYMEKITGVSEGALWLSSLLGTTLFDKFPDIFKYRYHQSAKVIILKKDIYVTAPLLEERCKHLPSYVSSCSVGINRIYPKTKNLSTCGGVIYLVNKDKSQLNKDIEYIQKLEEENVEYFYITKPIDS